MIKIPVRNSDTVRERLCTLNRDRGWSWRAIAQFDEYKPIPPGTLSAIAKGAPVPKKWRKHLGLPEILPTIACAVHGVVHDYDCQTQVVKPIDEPKPSSPRPRRYRDLFAVPVGELAKMIAEREEWR